MKPRTIRRFVTVVVLLLAMGTYAPFSSPPAVADIYRWDNGELITTLDAEPGVDFQRMDLSYADLTGASLVGARFDHATLTSAHLAEADLTQARFWGATLASADFGGAVVTAADFRETTSYGLTAEQFYSTASYQNGDVSGVVLSDNDLSGWDFGGKNLTGGSFRESMLTGVDFSEANLTGVNLYNATMKDVDLRGALVKDARLKAITYRGFTPEQLYSTDSYQNGDLRGIDLGDNDLTGWSFAEKDLSGANFYGAMLTAVDFAEAVVTGANLQATDLLAEQLYSTASYQDGDLSGIVLSYGDMRGWDFSGINLTNASLTYAKFTGADLSGAIVKGADFHYTTDRGFTPEQLYSTASYRNGDMTEMVLSYNDLSGWDLSGKNLARASFTYATLTDANLNGAILTNANFQAATLTRTSFAGATLIDARFYQATLKDADLSEAIINGAYFSEVDHLTAEQLYSTASYQNGDLSGIGLYRGDLSEWKFVGQNLSNARLHVATLTHADFTDANLTGASFYRSTLTDADFSKAVVAGADFRETTDKGFTPEQLYSTDSYQNGDLRGIEMSLNDLSGWDFSEKDLEGADFSHTILTDAHFAGATLTGVNFNGASLPLHLPMLPVITDARVAVTDPQFTAGSIVIDSGGALEITPLEFTIDCDVVFQLDDERSGLIVAAGEVTLGPETTLELTLASTSQFMAGTYTLIEAQGIKGTFGSLSGLGAYTTEVDLIYTDTTLMLQIATDPWPGDASLDMQTDLSDFNIWNANKFTADTGWTSGDFNGDGVTDLSDFNIWNAHKFTTASGGAAPAPTEVPEPGTLGLLGCALAIGLACRRWRCVGWYGLRTTDERR